MTNKDTETVEFPGGAKRSADADNLDFTSLPLIGLIGLARLANEGGGKYGRFNYMRGMPAHVCRNHAFRHLLLDGMGDRSEPHLIRAAWNCLVAAQSRILQPEINAPHEPGPGFTLTPEMLAFLESEDAERARRRAAGEFVDSGNWRVEDLAEIKAVLADRKAAAVAEADEKRSTVAGEAHPTTARVAAGPIPYEWVQTGNGCLKNAEGWEVCKQYNDNLEKNMYVVVYPNGMIASIGDTHSGVYSQLEWETREDAIAFVNAVMKRAG